MRKPTMLLKPSAFKTDKLYSILPENGNGDFSVSTYVGNGTRVNKHGLIEDVPTDTPRLDYRNGVGVLLEQTRLNQAPDSEDVSSWTTKTATITANDTIAPDGNKTADKLTETGGGQSALETITVSDATEIHTASIFLKFGNSEAIAMGCQSTTLATSFITCNKDGTTAIYFDGNSTIVGHGSEYYGSGWWRFYMIYDMEDTDTTISVSVWPGGGSGADRTFCWAWGMQLEAGSYLTSYIPTSGGGATRLSDVLTRTSTTTNGLITTTVGTFFVDLQTGYWEMPSETAIIILGTTNGSLSITGVTGADGYGKVKVNSTDTTTTSFTFTQARNKVAFVMSSNNVDVWVNGTKEITTSKAFALTSETLTLTGAYAPFKVREMAMWKWELNETELKSLTQ